MIEAKFYATFRDLVDGNKTVSIEEAITITDLLEKIIQEYPKLQEGILLDTGEVRAFVAVMVNGRDIRHLDGIETVLAHGDTVDIFPPVAGGSENSSSSSISTVSIRGLPEWLIKEYFLELGGTLERHNESLNQIVGDCWSATWSQQKVKIEGSSGMGLTQFDIVIAGSDESVERTMENFMKKAQRGGG
jgi:molybdopterin synthase sulfur carrier subunit